MILRKLQFYEEGGSSKHVRDIRSVLAVRATELDMGVIKRFAGQLGLAELWELVRRESKGRV